MQSARGLAQSKTLTRARGSLQFAPAFGLRRPSAAFEVTPGDSRYHILLIRD